ncbi:MAG: biosynthetic peptidoglycan transglycosylase [Acidobacteriota bacterium]
MRQPGKVTVLKRRTAIRIAAVLLIPLTIASIYALVVVRSATETTQRVIETTESFESSGLTPESLPADWLDDLLAVEDPSFYRHNGVDLTTPGAGLTTLTQGLVKIHYFDDFQPGLGKIDQTILALHLDRALTKRQQLVLLLNTARLGTLAGQQVSGFASASIAYFDKDVDELTHNEFLSLVAMLVGPNHLNVMSNPEENQRRVRRILAMLAGECSPNGLTDVYYEECAVSVLGSNREAR